MKWTMMEHFFWVEIDEDGLDSLETLKELRTKPCRSLGCTSMKQLKKKTRALIECKPKRVVE
jgi:hypothetical protein